MIKSEHAGQRIRRRLRELGRKQAWLADKIDVTGAAVSKFIRTGQISRENATEAARWLECSVDDPLTPTGPHYRDQVVTAFKQFVRELPTEELESVTGLLTIASRKFARRFNVPENEAPSGDEREATGSANNMGDGNASEEPARRKREKKTRRTR